MEKSRKPILGVGTSSILLIFVLLCMITFAVLSLVSARSDYRLSQKNAEHTRDYYEAENKANDILLTIDQCLEEQYTLYGNTEEYLQHVKSALENTEGILFSSERVMEYQVPAGEKQALHVALLLHEDLKTGDCYYQIKSWKLINTETWQPEETLPVYGSDT